VARKLNEVHLVITRLALSEMPGVPVHATSANPTVCGRLLFIPCPPAKGVLLADAPIITILVEIAVFGECEANKSNLEKHPCISLFRIMFEGIPRFESFFHRIVSRNLLAPDFVRGQQQVEEGIDMDGVLVFLLSKPGCETEVWFSVPLNPNIQPRLFKGLVQNPLLPHFLVQVKAPFRHTHDLQSGFVTGFTAAPAPSTRNLDAFPFPLPFHRFQRTYTSLVVSSRNYLVISTPCVSPWEASVEQEELGSAAILP
jgi:hypothetical protein